MAYLPNKNTSLGMKMKIRTKSQIWHAPAGRANNTILMEAAMKMHWFSFCKSTYYQLQWYCYWGMLQGVFEFLEQRWVQEVCWNN